MNSWQPITVEKGDGSLSINHDRQMSIKSEPFEGESSDNESCLSTDEDSSCKEALNLVRQKAVVSDLAKNGRKEENGESNSPCDEERLARDIELVHQRLIETGDSTRLRECMIKELYTGSWKHEMLYLCSEAVKKHQSHISFEELYSSVKYDAQAKVDEGVKQKMIEEVKRCYREGAK